MRHRRWLALIGFLVLFGAPPAQAVEPCGTSFTPRYFYSGFENGDLSGFLPFPSGEWGPGNGNTAYEVQHQDCASWARSVILSGFMWTDVLLGSSVQFKDGQSCAAAGVMYRFHYSSPPPQVPLYYLFVISRSGTASLMRFNGTTFDRVESVPFVCSPDQWYTVRVRAVGPTHTGYVNGVAVISWTDPTYPSGSGGPAALGTRAWFDNATCLVIMNPLLLAGDPDNPAPSVGQH